MLKSFRHAVKVIALVVALMSGILSLLREFLLFQYPNKFQERPLFWACLRIALSASLLALWYEERRKRIAAEVLLSTASRKPTIKQESLDLSAEILAFIYGRSQIAPKFLGYQPMFVGGNPAEMMRRFAESDANTQAHLKFDADTLGIYGYKFSRRVVTTIKRLKEAGIADEVMEGHWEAPANPATIKVIGEHLEKMADTVSDNPQKG